MNFIDKTTVLVRAGKGGDGKMSFRQEKFIAKGGPDGGDGGHGGDVVFQASRNQDTLAAFRYQRELVAEPGNPGGKKRMHGRSGKDLIVPVPVAEVADPDSAGPVESAASTGKASVLSGAVSPVTLTV